MHIGGFTALTSYGVTNILEFQNKKFMQKQTLELVEWNATPTTFHESICKRDHLSMVLPSPGKGASVFLPSIMPTRKRIYHLFFATNLSKEKEI